MQGATGAPLPASEVLTRLFSELVRFEAELWDALDARLRDEHGLPLMHLEPMRVIAKQERCRVFDIANQLSLSTGGTSKLIDAIEASGYCRRRPNPEDRRSSLIELTADGHAALGRATLTLEEELGVRLGSALSDRALGQFAARLAQLRAALRRHESGVTRR